ncbi:MAG: hypothetical protein ACK4ND_07685 [Cytophagaceae bacterium]
MLSPQDKNLLPYIYTETLYLVDPISKSDNLAKEVTIETPVKTETKPVITFSGNNKKGILVISEEAAIAENPQMNELFLKILSAVGLSDNDIALSIFSPSVEAKEYLNQVHSLKVISFGLKPQFFGLGSDLYQLIEGRERTYLFIDNITTIASDVNKKKMLWENLKKMFS